MNSQVALRESDGGGFHGAATRVVLDQFPIAAQFSVAYPPLFNVHRSLLVRLRPFRELLVSVFGIFMCNRLPPGPSSDPKRPIPPLLEFWPSDQGDCEASQRR